MPYTFVSPQVPPDELDETIADDTPIIFEDTLQPSQALNAWKDWLVRNDAGTFSVMDYGATGDGVADDTAEVQAAFAAAGAAAAGAVVVFPPGKTYKISAAVTITRSAATVPIWVLAYGAVISYTGSTSCLVWQGLGAHSQHGGIHIRGGRWMNTDGTGTTCFHMSDCINSTFVDITAGDWDTTDATSVFRIRNEEAWSENVSFQRIRNINGCSRLCTYEGATATGTGAPGTNSFARQRWDDVFVNGASDCVIFMNNADSVYDSWFTKFGGNVALDLAAGEAVIRMGGGMSGTRFDLFGFEGTGAIFNPAALTGNAPVFLPGVIARSPMTFVPAGADETKLQHWSQGTWTPVVTQSVTVTHTVVLARYVRRGTMAEVWAVLTMTSSGTASNEIVISGLPGQPAVNTIVVGEGSLTDVSQTPDITEPLAVWMPGNATVKFRSTRTTVDVYLGTATSVFPDALATGDVIRFHASYFIDAD